MRRPEPESVPVSEPEESSPRPAFHIIEGDGFVPGEDVTVAIVIGHTDASGTGTARALIDPARLRSRAAGVVVEVVLFGRISGITIIRRLPRTVRVGRPARFGDE